METNDEVVERQKLVPNDIEGEEDHNHTAVSQSAPISAPNPVSPTVPKINIKNMSSGDTTRSRNSASCSIERTSEKGQLTSAKVTYVNERRPRPHLHGNTITGGGINDDLVKSRPRKLLKDADEICSNEHNINSIRVISSEVYCNNNDFVINNRITDKQNIDSSDNKSKSRLLHGKAGSIDPSNLLNTSHGDSGSNFDKFDERLIKHHSFVSEVPDVKHMERALLGLLDDFHSGKLKAFGSGCTMEQMTKIREQQESLAKLHFELAAAEEDSLENVNDFNAVKAQENMLQLVQRLEQLSISIEQLQTSHTGL
ncbi:uncharacterized protein LOC128863491 isoform X1 [Anastrepha ludens]|uniref:uncharacterized protein LOC128863491 isoform X1 n=1 Tax=Anastrepha ludens TaxID=28586 RepID=UPI0023AFBEE5|nr:uncharacterized protein LOC128863491 isoform X1 [Anastrepha ludens]XP_053958657.1 uncharacterized protein LOC128863491 isoform X1 [Anastrepha ludens]